jgi:Tol biopolymer transport system component
MSDRELLERTASRFDPPDDAFERFTRLRDKRQRNKRIGAGVVAVVVIAVVAVGMSRALRHTGSTRRPAGPPTGISPSVREPGTPDVDYVLDLNTGAKTPLPEAFTRSRPGQGGSLSAGGYAISPDGSLLAYLRDGDDGADQIFIARIDGTDARQVTHANRPGEAAWSPDGTKIAYVASGRPGVPTNKLYVLDVASGESTQIAEEDFVEGPQFTPDGSSILYTHGTDSRPVIKIVPVAGGKSRPLFPLGSDLAGAENVSMSPDGSLITFLEQDPDGERRWLANADGTERRLLPEGCLILSPAAAWSPDGSRILCSDRVTVVVVDIATRGLTPVAEVGAGGQAIWLDDHKLLVDLS